MSANGTCVIVVMISLLLLGVNTEIRARVEGHGGIEVVR